MSIRSLARLIALACLIVGAVPLIQAQVVVTGRIIDPDGAAVAGVTARLEYSGRQVLESLADTEGSIRFPSVAPGEYLLRVPAMGGFADYARRVVVGTKVNQSIDVRLELASVSQNISIGPEEQQLSIDTTANRDQVVADANLFEHVPVFDQNYLAALLPFLDANGTATSGVSVVVDGIERKGTGVSASAIAEARIGSDPYTIETSRPGVGRIEIITKPGGQQLHGSLNFTFRDSVTDAKNYFATTKPFEQSVSMRDRSLDQLRRTTTPPFFSPG